MSEILPYLRVFFEVATTGSITGAAKRLRVAQPSVSRSIQKLEENLGYSLFVRKPRGVALTAGGKNALEHCRSIFRECDSILLPSTSTQALIRIAASENLCIHVLPKILSQSFLKSEQPDAIDVVSGTSEDIFKHVLNRSVDFGYCYHAARAPGIISALVSNVQFVVIAPCSAKKDVSFARSIQGLSLIGSRSSDYSGPYAAKSMLNQLGIADVRATIQSNSQEAQTELVASGMGYAIVPWFVAAPKVKAKQVVLVRMTKTLFAPLYRISRDGYAESEFYRKLDTAVSESVSSSRNKAVQ